MAEEKEGSGMTEEKEESGTVFDTIIQEVGEFGFYQKWRFFVLLILASYIATAIGGNMVMAGTFVPKFWCRLPNVSDLPLELQNVDPSLLKHYANFNLTDEQSGCNIRNLTLIPLAFSPNGTMNYTQLNATQLQDCPFSKKPVIYKNGTKGSLITDYDLICGQSYWQDLFLSVSAGVGIPGNYIFMVLIDYAGRKIMFFIITLYFIATSILCIFSINKYMFIVMQSLNLCCGGAVFTVAIIWLIELCGQKQRSYINGFFAGISSFTAAVQIVQAYFLPTWQLLYVSTTAPAVPVLLLWFVMDESPRWLSSKGRREDALKVLMSMAKGNGKRVSRERLKELLDKEAGIDTSKKGISVYKLRNQT